MPQLDLWIDLCSNTDNLFIREYYIAYNAFYQLRFLDKQDPQMIMLIRDKSKTKAIRKFELSLDNDGNHKKIHL
jgi:hypothetical protein